MLKVLVIDDEKLIRWSLKELFSQEGHQVDTVATAEDALKQIAESTYHLVFADLEINNVDGFSVLKKIKSIQPKANIIILSALSRPQIEPQLSDLSIFAIVEKPFNAEQIRAIARDALNNIDL
ncbi:response regulator [Acidobacteriota bacterium]